MDNLGQGLTTSCGSRNQEGPRVEGDGIGPDILNQRGVREGREDKVCDECEEHLKKDWVIG